MDKIDRRLISARFPFTVECATRFGDVDLIGHVNNVATAAIIEDARVRFMHSFDIEQLIQGLRVMVAGVQIDYLAEIAYPQPIHFRCGVLSVGRTSWELVQIAFQGDRPVTLCVTVMAAIDQAGAAPLPPPLRQALEGRLVRLDED